MTKNQAVKSIRNRLLRYYKKQCEEDRRWEDELEKFVKNARYSLKDPKSQIKQLTDIYEHYKLPKEVTIALMPLCHEALKAFTDEFLISNDHFKILEAEKNVMQQFNGITSGLDRLSELSNEHRDSDPSLRVLPEICMKIKDQLNKIQDRFAGLTFQYMEPLKTYAAKKEEQKESKQDKEIPKALRTAVVEMKDILKQHMHTQHSEPRKPPWYDEGKGFEKPASKIVYDILECLGINRISKEYLRKIY